MFKIKTATSEFQISEEALKLSETLSNLVEKLGIGKETEERIIPLDNVSNKALQLVIQYCEHHKNDPIRERGEGRRENEEEGESDDEPLEDTEISEWDTNFLQIDNELLFDLVCAANYLDIPKLLHVSCKTVALMARGRTTEELQTTNDRRSWVKVKTILIFFREIL
uniref:Skp1-related protein n=1 Tax=Caenorhabditis tropicalis TaxID=1561998 RepID=A0A1I7TSQ9_9PELO